MDLDDLLYNDRYCPLCKKVIDVEACYEIIMGIGGVIKMSAILPKVDFDRTSENVKICNECPYSDID